MIKLVWDFYHNLPYLALQMGGVETVSETGFKQKKAERKPK